MTSFQDKIHTLQGAVTKYITIHTTMVKTNQKQTNKQKLCKNQKRVQQLNRKHPRDYSNFKIARQRFQSNHQVHIQLLKDKYDHNKQMQNIMTGKIQIFKQTDF